jgi:hypothetical protein
VRREGGKEGRRKVRAKRTRDRLQHKAIRVLETLV